MRMFACATNLVEALDDAALRRFSMVVKFEPLRVDQRRAMFRARLTTLGLEPDAVDRSVLERLDVLEGRAGRLRQLGEAVAAGAN